MNTVCDWTAGHDRYVGTVPAAIAAYGFPLTTQRALIDQWERREFTDVVVIDRDSIRGQHAEYAPQLERMHFGGRGRICDTVSRAGWSAEHVETAIVLCAEAVCVAYPAVCGNVSIVTRIEHAAPLLPVVAPAYLDGPDLRVGGPIGNGPGYANALPLAPVVAEGQGGYGTASWGASAGFGYALAYLPAECTCCGVPVVAAVPEPMAAVLLIGGLAAVAVWSKRA